MNFKTTIILIVLLAVAAGLTIYVRTEHKETPAAPVASDKSTGPGKPLFDVKAADVDAITIKPADGEAISLKKSGSDWRLTQPVNAAALGYEVDEILRPLLAMRSISQVDPTQASGLSPAKYAITLTTSAGKTIGISMGDRTALGDVMYVRLDGSSMADVVAVGKTELKIKPVGDLRDKTLVRTSSDKIEQIVLQKQDGPKIVLHKEEGHWREVEPQSFKADLEVMSRLLGSISGLQANSFIKTDPTPAVTRLDEPQATVSFSTAPARTQPAANLGMTTIRLGQYDGIRKENVYATVSDSPEVVKVAASRLDDFKQTPLDFRDKELVNIDPELVKSFTVAINRPATTQPTTRPAELRGFTIERHKVEPRKIAPTVLGPALPPGGVIAPTTQPGGPTTRPVVATTQPATLPSVDDITDAKWIFTSGGLGRAEEGQVEELLGSFHPLHVEKYIEPAKETGNTYTLTIHAVPAKAADSAEDHVFTFIETPTRVIGLYKDLQFEMERSLIDKLTGDFKTKKVPPPPPPSMPPGFPGGGGGLPFGGGQ